MRKNGFRTVGEYNLDENGYLQTWDTDTVGYFVTKLADRENSQNAEITYLGGGSYGKAYSVKTESGAKVYKVAKMHEVAVEEYTTLKLLREAAGEVIPEVFKYFEANEGIPVDVIIEEYKKGANLINPRFARYRKKKRRALAEEVAAVLAKVREVKAEKFGRICAEKYDGWTEYYKKFAESVLNSADEGVADGRVKAEPVALAKEAFARFDEIFAEPVETPRLVHGDINIANILVEPKTLKLKAIIDPYGSVFGDPEYELFQLQNMWGDRFFLYETVKKNFAASEKCDLKCAFYALVNEIHCALKSGTSKGFIFDYMFKNQMKRLRAELDRSFG